MVGACSKNMELNNDSESKYHIFNDKVTSGSILGVLEVIKRDIPRGYTIEGKEYFPNILKINVCVGKGKGTYKDRQFLLETKLIYAMWMNASESFSPDDWKYFHFYQKSDCNEKTPKIAAFVTILSKATKKQPAPIITCERFGSTSASCSQETVYGYGAGVTINHTLPFPGEPSKFIFESPASLELNGTIKWQPLSVGIEGAQGIDPDVRKRTSTLYNELVASKNTSYEQLMELSNLIESNNFIYHEKNSMDEKQAKFDTLKITSKKYKNIVRVTAFEFLLHEIGHQFGMNHPDDEVQTVMNAGFHGKEAYDVESNPSFRTDQSVMAHGMGFLYLQEDDKRGIKTVVQRVRDYIDANQK